MPNPKISLQHFSEENILRIAASDNVVARITELTRTQTHLLKFGFSCDDLINLVLSENFNLKLSYIVMFYSFLSQRGFLPEDIVIMSLPKDGIDKLHVATYYYDLFNKNYYFSPQDFAVFVSQTNGIDNVLKLSKVPEAEISILNSLVSLGSTEKPYPIAFNSIQNQTNDLPNFVNNLEFMLNNSLANSFLKLPPRERFSPCFEKHAGVSVTPIANTPFCDVRIVDSKKTLQWIQVNSMLASKYSTTGYAGMLFCMRNNTPPADESAQSSIQP